ncbi:MAG: hypothetical protein AB7F99_02520 [Vicinamibacterales bacterium]
MEQQLRSALRRVEPSAGFSDRTLTRIAGAERARASRRRGRALVVALALAASVAVATGAGWLHTKRQAGVERARQDVERALRITSETLLEVQSKVQARLASVGQEHLSEGQGL